MLDKALKSRLLTFLPPPPPCSNHLSAIQHLFSKYLLRHYNESGAVIDTAGKEEHLIDHLIHSANLRGAGHACQVLWNTQGARSLWLACGPCSQVRRADETVPGGGAWCPSRVRPDQEGGHTGERRAISSLIHQLPGREAQGHKT